MDPVTLGMAKASAARFYDLRGVGFRSLMQAIREGKQSCALSVIGDSTGYTSGKTRWTQHLAAEWASRHASTHAVQIMHWNPGAEKFDAPVVLAGDPSLRCVRMLGGTPLQHYGEVSTAPTGDVDIRARLSVDSWTGNVPASNMAVISRWGGAGKNGFVIDLRTAGTIGFQWSADGTNSPGLKQSSALGAAVSVGTPIWIRVTLAAATGDVAFYTSTDGTTWTARGTAAGAGATSIFDPGANFPYQIGVYQNGSEQYTGRVYQVEVRDGLDGLNTIPRSPDAWAAVPSDKVPVYEGKPILTLVNGSAPGSGISYQYDTTRFPKMTPVGYNTLAVITNNSHNDTIQRGWPYLALWDAALAKIKARYKNASVIFSTQNPRFLPATWTDSHQMRQRELPVWAERNGLTVIDAYRSFTSYTGALTDLIDATDGTHPTDGTRGDLTKGSSRWGQLVIDTMYAQDY